MPAFWFLVVVLAIGVWFGIREYFVDIYNKVHRAVDDIVKENDENE